MPPDYPGGGGGAPARAAAAFVLPFDMPRLLLVDGHSDLYRAYYAIRSGLSAPDGTPTGAVYGFLRMFHKLLRELEPTHVAVAWDVGKDTFRTRLDPRYKATRPPMPDDLRVQVGLAQEALRLLGVAVLAEADVEADDVIGTLARAAAGEGFDVIVASADKDLMQLVRDPRVAMWHTRHERLLDEAGVAAQFGAPPNRVIDVLALMGDSSDNVPGCPGIGEKGARALIAAWGDLDRVLEHAGEVEPARTRNALAAHRDEVELSRALVTIRDDLELPLRPAELRQAPPDREGLTALYRRLGFDSLLAELGERAQAGAAAAAREVSGDELARRAAEEVPAAVAVAGGAVAAAFGDGVLVASAPPPPALLARLGGAWCHDAKALLARLRDAGLDAPELPRDALLAGYLLGPGEDASLTGLCRRLGAPEPGGDGPGETAAAVAGIAPGLAESLGREALTDLFETLEMPLVPVLEAMERHGIALDVSVLDELSTRLERSLAELEREIHAAGGGEFNVNSPQQLAEVLFERRGLPVLRRTAKTRAPSTDADVLAELAARGHRLPALILEYREQAKLKSTYVDALPRQVAGDGRIHSRFNQAVAATGRLSSSDPNLQNIPVRTALGREVRGAFVAAPGLALVSADYSQIELRVLAHFAEETTLIEAFARGEDIHRATAALVLGIAPELVGDDQRRAAKTVNFGLIYGMSAFSLGRELGIPQAEAQQFIDRYFARLPRVRAFLDGVKEQARRTGKVTTLFGRVRWITGLDARNPNLRGNAERQAINAPIQGTAADLMKLAMIRVHARLGDLPAPTRLLLQVHDELVLEAPEAAVDEAAAALRLAMEAVAELRVPLRVDVGHGRSWAAAKG